MKTSKKNFTSESEIRVAIINLLGTTSEPFVFGKSVTVGEKGSKTKIAAVEVVSETEVYITAESNSDICWDDLTIKEQTKLYKAIIQDNDDLDALLEEKSIYWNDDKEIVDTFVLKTIKRFDPANGKKQELLPEYNDDEDKEFARKLFRATILNADQYQRYMSDASRNWDFSRLAYMDVVIMQIAIAEMMTFMNIPISVTINEYVGLAKIYSTMKSGGYINGMLDTIARFLVDTGELNKPVDDLRPKKY